MYTSYYKKKTTTTKVTNLLGPEFNVFHLEKLMLNTTWRNFKFDELLIILTPLLKPNEEFNTVHSVK